MSTTASIVAKLSNGKFGGIYVHWDGYVSGVGSRLLTHYSTQEQIDKLIALGNLSALHESPDYAFGHSCDSPVFGHCIAYGRDRGTCGDNAYYGNTVQGVFEGHCFGKQNYNYVWDGEQWMVDGELLATTLSAIE